MSRSLRRLTRKLEAGHPTHGFQDQSREPWTRSQVQHSPRAGGCGLPAQLGRASPSGREGEEDEGGEEEKGGERKGRGGRETHKNCTYGTESARPKRRERPFPRGRVLEEGQPEPDQENPTPLGGGPRPRRRKRKSLRLPPSASTGRTVPSEKTRGPEPSASTSKEPPGAVRQLPRPA